MHNLIPHFIASAHENQQHSGTLEVVSLFLDISGFTQLTETLMQTEHRKRGVEALTNALHELFAPPVKHIYAHNGFVNTFAGDAFTALFPLTNENAFQDAIHTAFLIQAHIQANHLLKTPLGEFEIAAKIGIGYGQAEWEIISTDKRHTYYITGGAIHDCVQAEALAERTEIIASAKVVEQAHDFVETDPRDNAYVLKAYTQSQGSEVSALAPITPETMAKFAPQLIVNHDLHAEFRDVVNVFIEFDITQDKTITENFIKATMLGAIEYGGYFRQIDVGDKGAVIVCVFGAPVSYENNIARAADFLLTLQEKTDAMWCAGMTTGMTYVGYVGGEERSDYAAVGDVVNLAARLMASADYGEIRVHPPIVNALKPIGYRFEQIETIQFKGTLKPIMTSQLVRRDDHAHGDFDHKGTLVARSDELHALLDWCAPIFDGNFAGIGIVYGEAGIGKSRLITALHNNLSWTTPVEWIICPADEILQQSLNPFRAVLRKYFGQSAVQSLAENRETFTHHWERLMGNLTDDALKTRLLRNKAFIATFVDLTFEETSITNIQAEVRFDNMLESFKIFVQALCSLQATILYIQDAHWLDNDSITLIERLARDTADTPLLILMSSRYKDNGEKLAFDLTSDITTTTIDLKPIGAESVGELVSFHLEGNVASDLSEFIFQRTQGNPLFIEQLALHLREQRQLTYHPGTGWALNNNDFEGIPQNIRAVMVARLDRLEQEIRRVVQTASVLGNEFPTQVLHGITLVDGGNKETTHHAIIQAEIAAIWSALAEARYVFRHVLMRDAAYSMQFSERVRNLHHLAALVIEDMQRQDLKPYVNDLAFHFRRAESIEKERHYTFIAGQRALENFANSDAITYFTRLLEITPEESHQIRYDALTQRAHAYDLLGKREAQRKDLEALDTLAKHMQDDTKQAEGLLRWCDFASKITDNELWRNSADRAIDLTDTLEEPALKARALIERAKSFSADSQHEQVQTDLTQALAIAEPLDDTPIIATIYHELGKSMMIQKAPREALIKFDLALDLARQIDNKRIEAEILINYSQTLQLLGEHQQQLTATNKAMEVFETIGDKRSTARATNQLAVIYASAGNLQDAVPLFEKSSRILHEVGDRRAETQLLINLGNVAYLTHKFDKAIDYNMRAFENCKLLDDRYSASHASCNIGLYHRHAWHYEDAEKWFQDTLQICQEINNASTEADTFNNLGDLYRSTGRFEEAEANYDRAIAIYRNLDVMEGVSNSLAAKTLLLLYMQHMTTARDAAQEALDVAVTLDNPYVLPAAQGMIGHVLTIDRDYERAIDYYRQCMDNRKKFGEESLAMEPIAGLLRVALAQGNQQRIQQYSDEIYTFLQESTLGIAEDPIWVFLSCYDGLLHLHRQDNANAILAKGRDWFSHMQGTLSGEALQAFNTRIPSHRRMLALKP